MQAISVVQEQVDSQVDVRDCVAEVLSPFGVRMLSSVLKWNVDLLAVQQPAVLESVRRGFCFCSFFCLKPCVCFVR